MFTAWILLMLNSLFFTLRLSGGGSGSFPRPLKAEEERMYLERMAQGDLEARNILIEHNLRLVAHIMKKYYTQSADQEDLISIGTIGLIKGISTFKPDKNVRLATYASRCIENEILMHFRAQRKLQGEVSLSDSIDGDGDGNSLSLMDTISVDDNMLEELDARDSCAKVRRCVKRCLDEREAMIITLRYGLNARPPLTQREIAAQCGISRSYVSRRGYCKRGGGCLRGPGRPGRRRHPHCGVRAGKASFSEGGPECRTCGRHQHQWYSQLSGYRRYPATRSMNTLLEGLRVRRRPARVSRRLWSSSFQQSPITVRTARSTAIEVVWNCLAVSR